MKFQLFDRTQFPHLRLLQKWRMPSLKLDPAEFAPYFRSVEARLKQDANLMRRVFELRFQIYCLECNFLSEDNYPERRETDERDLNAGHFCTFNLQDELVGCVRLVRPDELQTFPFQSHCLTLLEGLVLPEPSQAAEISRLMVIPEYRRRRGDSLASTALQKEPMDAAHEMRGRSPQILLSLFRQMYAYSLKHDIRYLYAAMERPLARAMAGMNFGFQQIGPPTDYYGPVAPYLCDLREFEALLGKHNPALLAWMQRPEATED